MSEVSNLNDDKNSNMRSQRIGSPADGQKLQPGTVGSDNTTSGMNIGGSQVTVGTIKPVDRRTIEGSTPGDFRAQAAPAVLPDNPGPREPKGQSKVMSSKLDSPAPQLSSTEGSEGDRA